MTARASEHTGTQIGVHAATRLGSALTWKIVDNKEAPSGGKFSLLSCDDDAHPKRRRPILLSTFSAHHDAIDPLVFDPRGRLFAGFCIRYVPE